MIENIWKKSAPPIVLLLLAFELATHLSGLLKTNALNIDTKQITFRLQQHSNELNQLRHFPHVYVTNAFDII
jgi:hypothetical protein